MAKSRRWGRNLSNGSACVEGNGNHGNASATVEMSAEVAEVAVPIVTTCTDALTENAKSEVAQDMLNATLGEQTNPAEATPAVGLELLSDEQVQQFIVEGYLELLPGGDNDELGAQFHESILNSAVALGSQADTLGNNILPALPQLAQVFETQKTRGALHSLLGPGYLMHPHRFCHRTQPGSNPQTWHRDSYWGHWHARDHCPYWLMALYFPQDTPEVLGPTGILPRSQYFNKDEGGKNSAFGCGRFKDKDLQGDVLDKCWNVREKPLACRAGTIVLIHYDLWHRGAANMSSDQMRFMFKFQFSRMVSPILAPCSWNCLNKSPNWKMYALEDGTADLEPVWEGVWEWLCGERNLDNVTKLQHAPPHMLENILQKALQLRYTRDEPRRVSCAWHLACAVKGDWQQVKVLIQLLDSRTSLQGQFSMHLLQAIKDVGLSCILSSSSLRQSPAALHALGRMIDSSHVDDAISSKALEVLEEVIDSSVDADVQTCVAESLGCIRRPASGCILLKMLSKECVGDVRATVCHSLLRLLEANCLDESLDAVHAALLSVKQGDTDRYAAAYAAEALHRINYRLHTNLGCKDAKYNFPPVLIRWCCHGNGWNSNGNSRERTGQRGGRRLA